MLLWGCDELLLWSIIYVPEEIKLEHLCADPEAISSRTQRLAEVVNKYSVSTLYPQENSATEEPGTAQMHKENLTSGRALKIQLMSGDA